MDEFRIGVVPPLDAVPEGRTDDALSRRRRRRHLEEEANQEDVVSISEHPEGEPEDTEGSGYSPANRNSGRE